LNAVTRVDAQPIPRIDDTLDALAGAKWFSTLDLASGYWQVEVAEEDREKTAFSTPLGLFQFRVMPFGLCNAPATFQRLMEKALRGLTWKTCLVYLDDVIVFGKTEEEHLERLEGVLSRLQSVGLKIKPEKCQLMRQSVRYLGHIVTQHG
ncbi:Retrovirus-related Pol polyprotein from transposon, partial [Trichinella sp. T8]